MNTTATILLPGDFSTMPWKNGGGITHEIAREECNGSLLWRLSIAEVASDGAFSLFPGMTRLLAVIDGNGMRLETSEGTIIASPRAPVRFSGEIPVVGRLVDGFVRDLNFIFDARGLDASMSCLDGPAAQLLTASGMTAVLCLAGDVLVNDAWLPAGGVALGKAQQLVLSAASSVMTITADVARTLAIAAPSP